MFTGNSAQSGGAIAIAANDAQATLDGVTFTDNRARDSGGAVYTEGRTQIQGGTLTENFAESGGGVYSSGFAATVQVTGSQISDNTALSAGGGIFIDLGNLILSDSTISRNAALGFGLGGGLAIFGFSESQIVRTTISGNTAERGAGLVMHGDATIADSTFSQNSARDSGGAMTIQSGFVDIHQVTVSGNTARNIGGGIHHISNNPLLVANSTITGNRVLSPGISLGGGLKSEGTVTLIDSLVAGNLSGMALQLAPSDLAGNAFSAAGSSYNLIGDPSTAGGLVHGVNGNIVGDGLGGVLDIHTVLDTDLADNGGPTLTHALVPGSPAFNAGDPLFDPNATDPPTLYDQRGVGFDRVKLGRVDIGAIEGIADPVPVGGVIDVTTFDDVLGEDGLWSLREAVIYANAHAGDFEIQLAAGTYQLTRQGADEDAALTGDLDILNNGSVKIVGVGAGSTTIDASGLVDAGLGYGDRIFDVKAHAVFELRGLALTGGNVPTIGGAIRNFRGQVLLADSELSGNMSSNRGGAIHTQDGQLTISQSVISNNSAPKGGGIFNETPQSLLTTGLLTVIDSTLASNEADDGGAIFSSGPLSVIRSVLIDNTAIGDGGAIYANASMTISDSEMSGNSADVGGGVAGDGDLGGPLDKPVFSIVRSRIFDNSASYGGGGVFNSGDMTIRDSTLAGNQSPREGGAIVTFSNLGDSKITVINSTLSGNTAPRAGAILNFSSNLTVQSSTITGNSADDHGGGIVAVGVLQVFSTFLRNSILAGNTGGDYIGTSNVPIAPASAYNIIGDPNTAGGLVNGVNGNIVGDGLGGVLDIHTVLDTNLADNGGPTLTHALVPGSPAFNAGDPLFDPNATDPPTLYDQRGVGYARVFGGRLDIGAVEFGSTFQVSVVARQIFYDNSVFDGNLPGVSSSDANAIATDKQALLPGGLASVDNVTSYSRGINGVMVDLAGSHPDITAADFTFRVGASNDPGSWTLAPEPLEVVVLPGQGLGGADRVAIVWADGAIKNTYLQVIVAANANTGLDASDEFYFGNRIGDTFQNSPAGMFLTSVSDEIAVRNTPPVGNQPVTAVLDFDKNGLINASDQIIARNNIGVLPRIQVAPPVVPLVVGSDEPAVSDVGGSSGTRWAVATALSQPLVEQVSDDRRSNEVGPVEPDAAGHASDIDRAWEAGWASLGDELDSLLIGDETDELVLQLLDEAGR